MRARDPIDPLGRTEGLGSPGGTPPHCRPACLPGRPLVGAREEEGGRAAATDLRCRPPPRPRRICCSCCSSLSGPPRCQLLRCLDRGPRPLRCPRALAPQPSGYIAGRGRRVAEPRPPAYAPAWLERTAPDPARSSAAQTWGGRTPEQRGHLGPPRVHARNHHPLAFCAARYFPISIPGALFSLGLGEWQIGCLPPAPQ